MDNIRCSCIISLNGKAIADIRLPRIPNVGEEIELFQVGLAYKIINIRYRCAEKESSYTSYYCDDVTLIVQEVV